MSLLSESVVHLLTSRAFVGGLSLKFVVGIAPTVQERSHFSSPFSSHLLSHFFRSYEMNHGR